MVRFRELIATYVAMFAVYNTEECRDSWCKLIPEFSYTVDGTGAVWVSVAGLNTTLVIQVIDDLNVAYSFDGQTFVNTKLDEHDTFESLARVLNMYGDVDKLLPNFIDNIDKVLADEELKQEPAYKLADAVCQEFVLNANSEIPLWDRV